MLQNERIVMHICSVLLAVWITFSWQAVPGAKAYRIEASHTYGRTWSQLAYGATTETKIPLPTNMGLILIRLTVIYEEFGQDKVSSMGWWFDPTQGSPWMVELMAK